MSTHDIFRAKEISDKIVIMDNGKIIMQETAASLQGQNLEELYMNYMGGYRENVDNIDNVAV